MYDLIIKNGAVIDGTGAPAQHSDIAILDAIYNGKRKGRFIGRMR